MSVQRVLIAMILVLMAVPLFADDPVTPETALKEEIVVTASRIADEPARIPGVITVIDRRDLEGDRVFTTSEALRKAAGVNVRDEEGLGLRPNIGIRGLNPTRSSKVLLLEDGIPLAYAPYGDNASYYHPPIERYETIEIVKGSGQIAYGPSTVGGVINYVTPNPPSTPTLRLSLANGNRGYRNGELTAGGSWGPVGGLLTLMRKKGDGARDNTHSALTDVFGKITYQLTPTQDLTFRASHYGEDSQITYSGLREKEYQDDPRQNPFSNDSFEGSRFGAAMTHAWQLGGGLSIASTVYGSHFQRDWWRQSSNSAQRPNDSADAACGGMQNLQTTCGNEGRLRRYLTWGVESKARLSTQLGSIAADTELGLRFHSEDQERRQVNGDTPLAREGRLVENNERRNQAVASFVQTHFVAGRWTVSPGIRVEQIRFARTNRLAAVHGQANLTEIIPGAGVSYALSDTTTFFGGIHRGFAPPRTEDVISNATGQVVELDAERSWNMEAGVRSMIRAGLQVDASLFRMQYENQVVPASIAGGAGATLTNGGQTLHQGFELSGRLDSAALFGTQRNVFTKVAWTWIPTAEFAGERFSAIPGSTQISVTGNRLPYAPEQLLTAGVGYMLQNGSQFYVEAVHAGSQFADDLNTVTPTADGQRGLIDSSTVFNATVNIEVPRLGSTFFVTVKNALDRQYIVDRSRGILPASPRLIQMGFNFRR
jgi:Fe(3+) dicitrate transport protein